MLPLLYKAARCVVVVCSVMFRVNFHVSAWKAEKKEAARTAHGLNLLWFSTAAESRSVERGRATTTTPGAAKRGSLTRGGAYF